MGTSCFNFKQIQFYEQPLDFVHVRHHYLSEIKPNFNIVECNVNCVDSVVGIISVTPTPTPTPTPTRTITPTPTPTISVTPTFTPTPSTS